MEVLWKVLAKFQSDLEDFISQLHLNDDQIDAGRQLVHDMANIRTLSHPKAIELRAVYKPDVVKDMLLDMDVELLATALADGGQELIGKMSKALDKAHRAIGRK